MSEFHFGYGVPFSHMKRSRRFGRKILDEAAN